MRRGGRTRVAARPAAQQALEIALRTVLRADVDLTVAGRTDRGVHALGQVVSYDGDLPGLRSVNALLPNEIAVIGAEEAPAAFNARHDARSRTYCYRILARPTPSPFEAGRALWWPHPLDVPALEACAAALAGPHDFTAFTPTSTTVATTARALRPAQFGGASTFSSSPAAT